MALPGVAWGKFLSPLQEKERALSFYNLHTGEALMNTVFWSEGQYQPEALSEISYILRDHRVEQQKSMDPDLMDVLFRLTRALEYDGPVHVISGYRSPQTNAMLRSKSSGVAKKSLHMQGRAIDIRLPGRDLETVRQAALRLSCGGVGYYPKSNFVHVDTGRVRCW